MRFYFTVMLLIVSLATLNAQGDESNGLVNWLTFKEAQEKNKTQNKPFIIDFYTDWCGWCKHMMRTTYSNPAIAAYINQHFYPVKFNAEGKDTVEYNGAVYKPLSPEPRTPHELAIKFLGERLSYPSTVFVTNNYQYTLLSQGYLEEKKLEPLLVFMVENAWQTTVFDEFNKYFARTFVDTVFPRQPQVILPVSDLEKTMKKKPRKVLVTVGADFCNTCRVMSKTTFVDTSIADYVKRNFHLVNLDIAMQDTVIFRGEKNFSQMYNGFPIHSLAAKLTAGRFSLPALCVLDEQLNTIDVLNYYQSPERLKPILQFFGSNAYRTKKFNEFMEGYLKSPPPATGRKKGK